MAYLGIFSVTFISCIMGVLGSEFEPAGYGLANSYEPAGYEVAKSDVGSELEDEGRFFFGTTSATTGTGTGATGTVLASITGWETTLIVGVAFFIVFIVWIFLIFGLPSEVAATAHAGSAFDPFAPTAFASGHHAPTGFASGHHATGHHIPDSDLHSSYSVLRSLELAARKYL